MYDTLVILNLQILKWESNIFEWMSSHRNAVEDRSLSEGTHLAWARSQNTGNGILGINTNDKRQLRLPFFVE